MNQCINYFFSFCLKNIFVPEEDSCLESKRRTTFNNKLFSLNTRRS